jgi:type III pantothenate kinase
MNLLAVDIGNTDIKFGIFEDGELTQQWRASGTRTNPEKFSAVLRDSLARTGVEFGALAYTSVVPELEMVFRKTIQYCYRLPDTCIFAIEPRSIQLPLDFSRYPLEQLGTDRLVNVCAARLLYPDSAFVVVDFGTATTVNLVNREGLYLGGAIAPGLHTFMESLSLNTAQLPQVSLTGKTPENLHMGANTIACIQAGLGMGYRGLMKELLNAAAEALPTEEEPLFIATGGLAETIINLCGLEARFQVIDPSLTLKGLGWLYSYNRNPAGLVPSF